jgi:uncharacterized protein (TIGR00369 family)
VTTESADQRQAQDLRQTWRIPVGGPERAFGIGALAAADGTVSSSMPTGSWLNAPAGSPPGGTLGVLIDVVLGSALMLDRPPGRWSVSAEISVDLCRPVPADGSVLSAEGRLMYSDSSGGLASGSVADDAGRLIALCRQHGRWVSTLPDTPAAERSRTEPPAPPGPSGLAGLSGLLGAPPRAADGGASLDVAVTAELVNPMGNLHGGVTMWISDLVAQAALAAAGGPTRTMSVHVAYPRPMPFGTTVRFEGRAVHSGRTFGVARVTAVNESGKPCAIATVTASAGGGVTGRAGH